MYTGANAPLSDWVHDRYDDNDRRRLGGGRNDDYSYDRRAPAGRAPDKYALVYQYGSDLADRRRSDGTKLRVENLHYELTEDDVNVRSALHPVDTRWAVLTHTPGAIHPHWSFGLL